jgi:hypothetical protein
LRFLGHILNRVLDEKFEGEFKYLRKTINGIAPENAVRAFIELAGYLRLFDDKHDLSGYLAQKRASSLGRVLKEDEQEEPLFLRLTNKIMHAKGWKWDTSSPNEPKLICISNEPKRWIAAEIDIIALAAFCAQLMH